MDGSLFYYEIINAKEIPCPVFIYLFIFEIVLACILFFFLETSKFLFEIVKNQEELVQ